MEGHAGYVFLEESKAYVQRYVCEEAGGQSFFEIRCEHGKNPKDKTYAYAILPYATGERLDEYTKSPDVEILSNTSEIQAVREKTLGISSYVFYGAGKCGEVSTDSPAIIMIGERDGEIEFALTDPTHELTCAEVVIDRALEVIEKNRKISVATEDGKTVIKVDLELANGRPFRAKFKA